ncbi:MAG TPA: hypothetical protein VJA21_05210 [Verrucomicrobiae bacterium]
MSFANPTPIRLRMLGAFFGLRYRVVGRVVLGMEVAGQTYCWNEFNLKTTEGDFATLVFETDEQGAHWRLFMMFQPDPAITAGEAARKRVGDYLNLRGGAVRVTLVDESRVYHIEGEAPEGVEVGDVARYFNAEGASDKIVVSWTGDEAECYFGKDLSNAAVKSAFNLDSHALDACGNVQPLQDGRASMARWIAAAGGCLAFVIALAALSSYRNKQQPIALTRMKAPTSTLSLGRTVKFSGEMWQVRGHSLVEVAQVGRRYEQHEYDLTAADGSRLLFVVGFTPGTRSAVLFSPLAAHPALSPEQAGALRVGDIAEIDGCAAPVRELFQCTVRQTEGGESDASTTGTVLYGFIAQTNSTLFLARWNRARMESYRQKTVPPQEIAAALGHK